MTTFFSVDVETTGPVPVRNNLLSIGIVAFREGVLIEDEHKDFYSSIKMENVKWDFGTHEWWKQQDPEVFREATGGMISEFQVINSLEDWIETTEPDMKERCFVANPVAFDWPWINHACYTYLGSNPFGHRALCIRSMLFGLSNHKWGEDRTEWEEKYQVKSRVPHHAYYDALAQAKELEILLAERKA